MDAIIRQIKTAAMQTPDAGGRLRSTLSEAAAAAIADQTGTPLPEVFRLALTNGIWPLRYLRNSAGLTIHQQAALAGATVAVIGAGGLGGNVISALARIGIGRLIVIDGDRFDETNLNRQVVATTATLGEFKAHAAREFIRLANPGVAVVARAVRLESENAESLLADTDVAVDALDNVPSRQVLIRAAKQIGIPVVHGAVAGFDGHVMTVLPDDDAMVSLYGSMAETNAHSAEKILGVPSVTPALIAALQAMEVIKLVCGIGSVLKSGMHHIDLLTGDIQAFRFQAVR